MSFGTTITDGGFDKVVWENCADTLPGGVTIDVSGVDAEDYPDGVIPEGTPISKNLTTGLATIVTIVTGTPNSLSATPIGYTNQTVKLVEGTNVMTGVGISGVVRIKALSTDVQANIALFKTALPKITHV